MESRFDTHTLLPHKIRYYHVSGTVESVGTVYSYYLKSSYKHLDWDIIVQNLWNKETL